MAIDNSWKTIQQQIKMNTLNSKNEVAMANRKATKNMDNYLKALGIQGSGVGQSSYTGLASQYANQLADINRTEQQDLLDAQNTQTQNVKDMIDEGTESSVVQDTIADLKSQGFNTTEIERYQKSLVLQQSKQLYGTMLTALQNGTFVGDKNQYLTAISELENAIKTNDATAIQKAYDYASNVAGGTPNLNETKNTTTEINDYKSLEYENADASTIKRKTGQKVFNENGEQTKWFIARTEGNNVVLNYQGQIKEYYVSMDNFKINKHNGNIVVLGI